MTLGIRSNLALTAGGLLAVTALLLSGGLRAAEPVQRGRIAGLPDAGDFEVLQLRPNFYMIAGAGSNIGVQVGADGVVVVDAGSASKAEVVLAAIKRITARPIRYVIDTNADAPSTRGGGRWSNFSISGKLMSTCDRPVARRSRIICGSRCRVCGPNTTST